MKIPAEFQMELELNMIPFHKLAANFIIDPYRTDIVQTKAFHKSVSSVNEICNELVVDLFESIDYLAAINSFLLKV